jgi:hypothetical protein
MGMATYGLIVTVIAMVGVAVFILLFERRRAREIEADLRRPPPSSEHDRRDGQSPDR